MTQALAVALTAALLLAGCRGSSDSALSPSDLPTIELRSLVSSFNAAGIQASARPGQPPRAGSGPAIDVQANNVVVNGGTLPATVTAAVPFQTVYLYVAGRSVGLASEAVGGVDGYYEVRLPAAQRTADVLLTVPQTIPLTDLDLRFAVADASGGVGPSVRLATRVTIVGTGDVQVTLSWNTDADVDLHVVDPSGEEIYWQNRQSRSGGTLDLDSNAGCSVDGVRNENITWPTGRAPRGTYIVRVDYWSNCGADRTDYTVRVNVGGNVQIFNGNFTGPGDQGGAGSGRPITTFERTTGPTVTALSGVLDPVAAAESERRGKNGTRAVRGTGATGAGGGLGASDR